MHYQFKSFQTHFIYLFMHESEKIQNIQRKSVANIDWLIGVLRRVDNISAM